MTGERRCTATTRAGKPCRGRALPGQDVCITHAKTAEQTREHARRAKAAQTRASRAKKPDYANALRQEVVEAKALDTAAKLLNGVPLSSPDSVRTYLGKRRVTHEGTVIGLHILLALTGPHVTPHAAREALNEALPPGVRPSFVPPPEDVYRASRAEWRRAAVRYSDATGLFALGYPPQHFATWEDVDTVLRNEPLPDVSEWAVSALGDSTTHVRATEPNGTEHLIPRALAGV